MSGSDKYYERLKGKLKKSPEPAASSGVPAGGASSGSVPVAGVQPYARYDPQRETVDEFEQRVLLYEAQVRDSQEKLDFVRPLLLDDKLLPASAYQMRREMDKFDITKKEVAGLRSELDTLKKGGL